jgi:hypothetical protein
MECEFEVVERGSGTIEVIIGDELLRGSLGDAVFMADAAQLTQAVL